MKNPEVTYFEIPENAVRFVVEGTPVAQGSMKAVKGPHQKFARVIADNKAKLRAWRELIALVSRQAYCQQYPNEGRIIGPVVVVMQFYFARPKKHFINGDMVCPRLKKDAPRTHYKKPDIDKLERAILDGLTGPVIKDDCQVSEVHKRKSYTDGNERVEVVLYPDRL